MHFGTAGYNRSMTTAAIFEWAASDSTRLRLRPVRPDDAARVHRSLALLSPEARRQRLLATTRGFSEAFVNSLVDGDPAQQYAVLVVRDDNENSGEEIPVAGGRLVLTPAANTTNAVDTCEFALIVGDRWQGQGIGQNILYALIAEARRRKLRTMVGDILPDNHAMLTLARNTGFFIEGNGSDNTLRATLDLGALVVTQALKDRRFNVVPPTRSRARSAPLADSDADSALPPAAAASPLRATLLCAALAMAGLLLAMVAVWAGTGWLDGFNTRGISKLEGRFIRVLPWALPLAAAAGVVLYTYFRWAIEERHKGWVLLFAVIRAFALFPLLGFAMLFGVLFVFAAAIPLAIYRKFFPGQTQDEGDDNGSDNLLQRALVVPLWIITLPFTLLKVESEGDIDIPARISRARLLNWLPVFFLMLLFGPGFESEEPGDRINPNWLVAIATYWLADLFIVTGHVAPTLAAHARRRRLAKRMQQP